MKFLCNTEFIHSGAGIYFSGTVYPFTVDDAKKLIDADKKKPLGALSFFTPADEEALSFIKGIKDNGGAAKKTEPPPPNAGEGSAPKPPARAGLIAEAKSLGIKGADRMNVDGLKEAISAKKTGTPERPAEPPVQAGDD